MLQNHKAQVTEINFEGKQNKLKLSAEMIKFIAEYIYYFSTARIHKIMIHFSNYGRG